MLELICIFGHEPVKELFQIAARRRCGIFHDDETAAGMVNKNVHNSTHADRLIWLWISAVIS